VCAYSLFVATRPEGLNREVVFASCKACIEVRLRVGQVVRARGSMQLLRSHARAQPLRCGSGRTQEVRA
jgi:hypothetical protein